MTEAPGVSARNNEKRLNTNVRTILFLYHAETLLASGNGEPPLSMTPFGIVAYATTFFKTAVAIVFTQGFT